MAAPTRRPATVARVKPIVTGLVFLVWLSLVGWLVAKTSIKCKVQQAVVTTVASVVVRAELRRVREGGKRLRVFMSFFSGSG